MTQWQSVWLTIAVIVVWKTHGPWSHRLFAGVLWLVWIIGFVCDVAIAEGQKRIDAWAKAEAPHAH